MEGEFVVVRSVFSVAEQAKRAGQVALSHGITKLDDASLKEFAKKDYQQFCLLVEALHTLGKSFSQEIMDLAQMGPIEGNALFEE